MHTGPKVDNNQNGKLQKQSQFKGTEKKIKTLFFCKKGKKKQLQEYYMSIKTELNLIYCNHMFHSHSIPNPTFPTPSTFPS